MGVGIESRLRREDRNAAGVMLHAKHAFMPNDLGYCGPDAKGEILRHLHERSVTDGLLRSLRSFEAAYPFIELIARCTGREVYDPSVIEAYWIGNELLERVPNREFYRFSHSELRGRDRPEVKRVFRKLGSSAMPHHTFHVMSAYATSSVRGGPSLANEKEMKVAELVENCRISGGQVAGVEKRELRVEARPVEMEGGRFVLGGARVRKISYDPEICPFESIKRGDRVTMHWGFACDVVDDGQARNLERYTLADLRAANRLLER